MFKYALNMLYLCSFCSKNVVFAQTVTFLRKKKTAGGRAPGLKKRLYADFDAYCI